ncbi:hypothetical protein KUTeg_022797 [Tegillarca granosa]|uniref:Uncharacterized protein n=1 Tax=Tegillarca granosa TaxID=220873 RepID=A0ABQ9E5B6_TEGGR|nr:hypothetical protein KUTeg_022797 [Tegillarca granosa]
MPDKRKWSKFASWGKRDPTDKRGWSKFASWGKRDDSPIDTDKRKWNTFNSWGKRSSWNGLQAWGKRSKWSALNSWGKRDGQLNNLHDYLFKGDDLAKDEEDLLKTLMIMNTDNISGKGSVGNFVEFIKFFCQHYNSLILIIYFYGKILIFYCRHFINFDGKEACG